MALRPVTAHCGLFASLAPGLALAHGLDERYDLPAPLYYFAAGAAAAVTLSFVVVAAIAWQTPADEPAPPPRSRTISLGPLLPAMTWILRPLSLLVFAITVAAALWGTGNPMMNLAPTLVWVFWWMGGSLLVACIGNFWPVLDPWRTIYQIIDTLARFLGRKQGASLGLPWPRALDAWPAVMLLLTWSACEVVFPLAAVPYRIGVAAIVWTVATLAGMACFGRETWQRHGDVFAVYFETLGRFAPLASCEDRRRLLLRPFGSALIETEARSMAMTGFVIAMLAGVLFDGLLAGEGWSTLEPSLRSRFPQLMDANGYLAGSLGLIFIWAAFVLGFLFACTITGAVLGKTAAAFSIAKAFAPTLVPIAIAYSIAHNFSSLLIQGQNLIPLLSDPLGAGWDLFGTTGFRPNQSIVDARFTWCVAIGAIVMGHVLAVWLGHRVALQLCQDPRRAVIASMPMTILMVAYTAISLLIIAAPMVKFG
ncbi:MAG: hypothetical protein HY017_26550 [Betaproteobacteria bacterium]|nr:hypothetical protein [Betaproteobacteria bacterium]